jgi:hypothetical protein
MKPMPLGAAFTFNRPEPEAPMAMRIDHAAVPINDKPPVECISRQRSVHIVSRRQVSTGEDKENVAIGDESWSYVGENSGRPGEVGKEMKNVVPLEQNGKRIKERKSKRKS